MGKSIFVSMPKKPCLDTATGGLNVTIKCQVVVYAPAERAEKLLLFLLNPCLLCDGEKLSNNCSGQA